MIRREEKKNEKGIRLIPATKTLVILYNNVHWNSYLLHYDEVRTSTPLPFVRKEEAAAEWIR